ncbi:D-aspartate oxidase isoform X2 [Bacillus rossius redtenbacheri]|uniref:D-aspartate oxidase isoform X2 n=1 Tax=Bacillus rossius redtenbacheri TaxID=93214 RepID=UPI002FDCF542
MPRMTAVSICVLGAGVVGMTTALELRAQMPSAMTTVIADKFREATTSDGAAGIFRPGSNFSGETPEITKKWIHDSYTYYNDLYSSDHAELAGVDQVSGFMFSNISEDIVRNHLLEGLVPTYRAASEEELHIYPGGWKHGSFFTTLVTDCRKFLPWAMYRFQESGGTIQNKTVKNLMELTKEFDFVVNCSGLGARQLCSDKKMVPIRGQVLKVQAPWMKMALYAENDTYIIPSSSSVTVGGCRQYDSYDLSVSPHDSAAIKERAYRLLPALRSAPVDREWVGLRPHRSVVRVEPEVCRSPAGTLKVVHNYGHGGYGVTSAPGTARYAVKLLKELHSAGVGNSKL